MRVRKEDSRESILSACPCLPVVRLSGSRRSVQHAGARQSKFSQRLVLQVNVIRSVLLKLWPLVEPGRLVSVSQRQSDGNGNLFSTQSFLDWKEQGDYSPGWELMCPGNSISAIQVLDPSVSQAARFPRICRLMRTSEVYLPRDIGAGATRL